MHSRNSGKKNSMNSSDMYTGRKRTTWLTSLAQKYSHPIGTLDYTYHRILTSTGKSGLTPISSPLPPPITEERLKKYQKRRSYGFSAAELEEIGMMAALGDEQMATELTNPIHPMYVRSQWESLADWRTCRDIGAQFRFEGMRIGTG
jgi:hypothetical protein